MTDPWTLHAALTCPSCHVAGKVVTNEADEDNDFYAGHEAPYTCVECGSQWLDHGTLGDVSEYRQHWSRLVEGRPYEPPPPVQREPGKGISMDAYDAVLRQYYGPERVTSYAMQVKLGEPVRAKPTAWNDVMIESGAPNPWPFLIGSLPDLPGPEDE